MRHSECDIKPQLPVLGRAAAIVPHWPDFWTSNLND